MHTLTRKQALRNLWIYCLGYLFVFPLLAGFLLRMLPASLQPNFAPLLEASIYIFVFLVVVFGSLTFLKVEWEKFWQNKTEIGKEILKNQLLMYGLNFICNFTIMMITGLVQSNNQSQVEGMLNTRILATVFLTIGFAPIVEELVFRGSIFRLTFKQNRKLAIFLASCAFGLLHVVTSLITGDWLDCLYFLSYASMGYCLSRCYVKTDCIWGPIGLHLLNNLLGVLVLLLL